MVRFHVDFFQVRYFSVGSAFSDLIYCGQMMLKVLEGLFLEGKKSKFTGEVPHWDLHNFGMDLFLIIFVNFKTPCLHGNSS